MKKIGRNCDLPDELVREILLRLHVKVLLQCKCVCKGWCALIGSRSFIDDHFGHESNQDCLLIQFFPYRSQQRETKFISYTDGGRHVQMDGVNYISNMPFDDKICDLLGPANGVFCLVRPLLGRVALFNPATRKFKPLPPIPFLELRPLQFAFRFDSISGDYKVVALERERESERFFCVYSSSSDSWRKTEAVNCLNTSFRGAYGCVFLNGVFYWENIDIDLGCESILALDMRNENFQEILVPEAIRFTETHLMVDTTAYGEDSLALLSFAKEDWQCIDKWVLRRDGLWTKCFSIDLPLRNMWPRFVWNKNVLLLEDETSSALFLYDISTQKLRIFELELYDVNVWGFFSYKESFVSLRGERDRAADCVQDFFD